MAKRTFKKLLLKAQLLDIEEQEYAELDIKYASEYSSDFREEHSLLTSQQAKKNPIEKKAKFNVPVRVLKKLHRKLAMATHPDISAGDTKKAIDPEPGQSEDLTKDQSFIEVQSAYESGDAGKLLTIACDMDIEVDLTEKEMLGLRRHLKEKKRKLENLKLSVRWVWCTSDKSEGLKSQIRKAIGISDEVWNTYLQGKEPLEG